MGDFDTTQKLTLSWFLDISPLIMVLFQKYKNWLSGEGFLNHPRCVLVFCEHKGVGVFWSGSLRVKLEPPDHMITSYTQNLIVFLYCQLLTRLDFTFSPSWRPDGSLFKECKSDRHQEILVE